MNSIFKEKNINFPNYWNWNGIKVCWSVSGEDNEIPIIFIDGFGASRKHWRNNLKYFAKRNCASYSLDLIGFGDSDQPGIRQIGKLNNEIWCNQVKDFITQVIRPKNSGKVILIGNSLGSLVALTCAVSLEDQIATVIASPLPDQIQEYKKSITKKSLLKKFQDRFIKIFFIFFPLEIILFLIAKLDNWQAVDTTECVSKYLGMEAMIIPGDPRNMKVTYIEDIFELEKLIEE